MPGAGGGVGNHFKSTGLERGREGAALGRGGRRVGKDSSSWDHTGRGSV